MTSRPYTECTPAEIVARMSPVLKNSLLHLVDAPDVTSSLARWDALHGRDKAALVDRTLVTAGGGLTPTGERVVTIIRVDRAAVMEAKYQ